MKWTQAAGSKGEAGHELDKKPDEAGAFQEKHTGKKASRDTWLIMALLGILLLIVVFPTGTGNRKNNSDTKKAETSEGGITDSITGTITESSQMGAESLSRTEAYARALEKRLEETLRCMEGAGAVKVMITLKSSEEAVVEKDVPVIRNSTVENDAEGGSRSVNEYSSSESTIYGTDQSGTSTPYVVKKMEPAVEGVVVIAQGGGNEKLCKNITEAIQALFGIEPHKIKVVKMKTTG